MNKHVGIMEGILIYAVLTIILYIPFEMYYIFHLK